MEELFALYLDNTTEKNKYYNEDTVRQLQSILRPLGINLSIEKDKLYIECDGMEVFYKINRMAGRKEKHYGKTPAEVRELIKENGCTKAAEILGISKAMMYRRLNKAEKEGKTFI